MVEPIFSEARALDRQLVFSPEPRDISEKATDHCVPGHPLLALSDEEAVQTFLQKDILHDRLDSLAPIMWLVATQSSKHISSLHHQLVRGRTIVITEDPGLHLLWYYDRIFIKPLPPYLTNHAFWKEFLCGNDSETRKLRGAALGYLRSYSHLIQCLSDFDIAKQNRLVPSDSEFADVLKFLHSFATVQDEETTPRYHYGELRLSRLNLYIKFYKFELYYHKTYGQYGEILPPLVAPFAFIFATVSVALSAIQVVLSVKRGGLDPSRQWVVFSAVSEWFSIACLIIVVACAGLVALVITTLLLRELIYALGHGRRRRQRLLEEHGSLVCKS